MNFSWAMSCEELKFVSDVSANISASNIRLYIMNYTKVLLVHIYRQFFTLISMLLICVQVDTYMASESTL
jgi:hypothetical protein